MKQIDEIKKERKLPGTYLGDGAYAYFEDRACAVVVTAENGIEAYEEVFLEPEAVLALINFSLKHMPQLREHIRG